MIDTLNSIHYVLACSMIID